MMNKKLTIACFTVAIAAVAGWLTYQYLTSTGILDTSPRRLPEEPDSVQSAVGETKKELEVLLEDSPKIQKLVQLGQAANRDINFYGLVQDQFGEPVSDVSITYSIPTYGDGLGPLVRVINARTDKEGIFRITGERGTHILMRSMERPGYVFESMGGRIFRYLPRTIVDQPFKPDAENPVIFRAWKKMETAKELKTGNGFWGIKGDGEFHGLPIPETDKAIQIKFEQHPEGNWVKPLGWSVHIRVDHGGVLPAEDSFMYEAPTSGYRPEWSWYAPEQDGRWPVHMQQKFYFQTGNGNMYGRMDVKFIPYYGKRNQGVIDVKYVLNPTGSRNLLNAAE